MSNAETVGRMLEIGGTGMGDGRMVSSEDLCASDGRWTEVGTTHKGAESIGVSTFNVSAVSITPCIDSEKVLNSLFHGCFCTLLVQLRDATP